MSDFWINLYKFPRFLTSVFIGFFLTTLQPIFQLFKKKRERIFVGLIIAILIGTCYKIIVKMTGLE